MDAIFHGHISAEDLEPLTLMTLHRLYRRRDWPQLMEVVKREASGFRCRRPRSSALRLMQYVWYVSIVSDSTVYEGHTNLTFKMART